MLLILYYCSKLLSYTKRTSMQGQLFLNFFRPFYSTKLRFLTFNCRLVFTLQTGICFYFILLFSFLFFYAFDRQFYPKQLTLHSYYTFFSSCIQKHINRKLYSLYLLAILVVVFFFPMVSFHAQKIKRSQHGPLNRLKALSFLQLELWPQ